VRSTTPAFEHYLRDSFGSLVAHLHNEVVLDVPVEAEAIALGTLLVGEGEAWLSDFAVETVGPDVDTTDTAERTLPDQPHNLDFAEGFAQVDR
jgi:hypothetical protein